MVTEGQPVRPISGPVRAVVFDLFITLTDWDAERRRPGDINELATALGVDPAAFTSLMRATFAERVMGAMGDARAALSALAARMGCDVPADRLDVATQLRTEHTRGTLTPRAGVIEALAQLRAGGYLIGVLSDCTAETVDLWPSLPYAAVVDAVTFSCEVGQRKPHPAGYEDIVGQLGVAAEECVYVGDGSSSELTGATAVGMTAVLLETPFGADFRYDAEEGWTGRRIRDIGELERLLRQNRRVAHLTSNQAIEHAAIAWVVERERAEGRQATDVRYSGAPYDIDSPPRAIEVKAVGGSGRGFDLWLETSQVDEARRNANFFVYVVENVRQGDPGGFTLKVLGGERLRRLLDRAKERHYYSVPWPVADYDAHDITQL